MGEGETDEDESVGLRSNMFSNKGMTQAWIFFLKDN